VLTLVFHVVGGGLNPTPPELPPRARGRLTIKAEWGRGETYSSVGGPEQDSLSQD